MTDGVAKSTTSAGHVHPICCQLATCTLGQKKKVIFLEANSKVGYVLESVLVRINKNLFCLKEKALNSSKETGAKKRNGCKELDGRICCPCLRLRQWLYTEDGAPSSHLKGCMEPSQSSAPQLTMETDVLIVQLTLRCRLPPQPPPGSGACWFPLNISEHSLQLKSFIIATKVIFWWYL